MGTVFEKFKVFGAVLEGKSHAILEVVLGQVDVVREVGKANLGLDHPKFSQVTSSVGVFGTECRTKGVNIRQGAGVGFDIELSRNGQVDALSKEIIRIIDGSNHMLFDWFCGVDLGLFLCFLFGASLEFLL